MLYIFIVPTAMRRGCKSSAIGIKSSGFPYRNELQLLHTDAASGKYHSSYTHSAELTSSGMVSWCTKRCWISCVCHPGCVQQLSSIPNTLHSLPLSCLVDLQMAQQPFSGYLATQRDSCNSSAAHPTELDGWQESDKFHQKKKDVPKDTRDTNAALSWRGLKECAASQEKWICPNPTHGFYNPCFYKSNSKPASH